MSLKNISRKNANKAKLKQFNEKNAPLDALHSRLFPEEYDFYYDSNVDAKLREKGINPMSDEYQQKVNLRRLELKVEPYMGSVGVDNTQDLLTSWEYCRQQLAL